LYYFLHRIDRFAKTLSPPASASASPSSTKKEGVRRRRLPVVICGDMNSKPNSIVHEFLSKGSVDATRVAPWNYFREEDRVVDGNGDGDKEAKKDEMKEEKEEEEEEKDSLSNAIGNLKIQPPTDQNKSEGDTTEAGTKIGSSRSSSYDLAERDSLLRVRYLCDMTLNKFTRWLRILGIDAALETEAEEKARTKEGKM